MTKKMKTNWGEDSSNLSSEALELSRPERAVDSIRVDVLSDLADRWSARAVEIENTAKAYNCRSTDSVRIAYIKQAQRLRMCADQLRALIGGGDADQGA